MNTSIHASKQANGMREANSDYVIAMLGHYEVHKSHTHCRLDLVVKREEGYALKVYLSIA